MLICAEALARLRFQLRLALRLDLMPRLAHEMIPVVRLKLVIGLITWVDIMADK